MKDRIARKKPGLFSGEDGQVSYMLTKIYLKSY